MMQGWQVVPQDPPMQTQRPPLQYLSRDALRWRSHHHRDQRQYSRVLHQQWQGFHLLWKGTMFQEDQQWRLTSGWPTFPQLFQVCRHQLPHHQLVLSWHRQLQPQRPHLGRCLQQPLLRSQWVHHQLRVQLPGSIQGARANWGWHHLQGGRREDSQENIWWAAAPRCNVGSYLQSNLRGYGTWELCRDLFLWKERQHGMWNPKSHRVPSFAGECPGWPHACRDSPDDVAPLQDLRPRAFVPLPPIKVCGVSFGMAKCLQNWGFGDLEQNGALCPTNISNESKEPSRMPNTYWKIQICFDIVLDVLSFCRTSKFITSEDFKAPVHQFFQRFYLFVDV